VDLNETIESQSPREPAGLRSGSGLTRLVRTHPRISAAVVLWLASWAFVSAFSNLARWETGAQYDGMASLCRWDCNWYGSVLQSGYSSAPWPGTGDANWLFHPLLPLLAYPFYHWMSIPAAKSLVLVSKGAFLLSIYAFLLMVRSDLSDVADYFRAGALVAFNPYLIYGHAGYSEPLYFAFLCLAFYFAERKQWLLSGSMGTMVSATRMVGFVFAIPYALFALRGVERENYPRTLATKFLGLLLCPLGTAAYMLYLYLHTGDALAQEHIHLSWVHFPPQNPFALLLVFLAGQHWARLWGLMCLGALVAAIYLFRLRKPEYGVYLLIAVLLSISGGLYGLPRYIWWQPPLLYAIYRWMQRHPSWWVPYIVFTSGMAAFMVVEWFSGHGFVA